jgi:VCBS repeat-containing protein
LVAGDLPLIPLGTGVSGVLPVANGGTGISTALPVDIPCSYLGKPGAGASVQLFTAVRAINFAANFAGAYGTVGTNPTATALYTVNKNGSAIGTVSIATTGVFTFATTSGAVQSLAAGDRMTVVAPTAQDTTLADVGFTLPGTR